MDKLSSGKQIFICFSGKDRHSYVKSVVDYLQNFGFNIWYDYQQTLLGDHLDFKTEIDESSYAILIFSKNFMGSDIAKLELERVKERLDEGKLHLFPIFFHYDFHLLPPLYEWITTLKFKEVNDSKSLLHAMKQLVCKLLTDELEETSGGLFYCDSFYNGPVAMSDKVLRKMIATYRGLNQGNHSAKMTLLYALYTYLRGCYKLSIAWHESQTMERLCTQHNLDIKQDNREIRILEIVVSLIANRIRS